MEIKKIQRINPYKENHYSKLDKSVKKVQCVYMLFDKDLKLVYVGRTKDFRVRLLQHISVDSNSRYDPDDKYRIPYTSKLPEGIVEYYSIIETKDFIDSEITELLLIKFLKPIFNYTKDRKLWDKHKHNKQLNKQKD